MDDFIAKANSLMADDKFDEAIALLNTVESPSVEVRVKRSACFLKTGKALEALNDANEALKMEGGNVNALFRKGAALFELDEFEAALDVFKQGEALEKDSSRWGLWIRKCSAELESDGVKTPAVPAATSNNNTTTNTTTTTTNTTTTGATAPAQKQKIRHEWYQTDTHVVVTIFCKGLKKETVQHQVTESSLSVTLKLDADNDWILDLQLAGEVVPDDCRLDILSTKIELWLKKRFSARWPALEAKAGAQVIAPAAPATVVPGPVAAPYASKKKIADWDKFVADQGELDDDDPLNKVFKDIYGKGSEEQRRAMMKSYVESGGTVLSTNWQDVGAKKVEVSPPDGMVAKSWKDDTIVAKPEDRKDSWKK